MSAISLEPAPVFVQPGARAADLVTWERRQVVLRDAGGRPVSAELEVEVPAGWSDTAAAIAATRYLQPGESSVRQLVDRVVHQLVRAALEGGYFEERATAEHWGEELSFLVFTQRASFNSPVWFNVGVRGRPQQAAACFINSVEDSMESILELARIQGRLFKLGSGSGVNLSGLRSSRERLSSGRFSSGPLPFMRALDALAGAIRAGSVRRAASIVSLDISHPDILEFIRCKAVEERKAWALMDAGYSPEDAYGTVSHQNANHSVRVRDDFVEALIAGRRWPLRAVTDGRILDSRTARELWGEIALSAWACGDPGLQFDDAVQGWNTVPVSGRINASNPCGEFAFLDDTACNLLSLNLLEFGTAERSGFDARRFRAAVRTCFRAQEVLVSISAYPTPEIAANTERLRPIGLGFTNLGGLLTSLAIPYDSSSGRRLAASISALMTAEAYLESSRLAALKGRFADFDQNRAPMLAVIERHAAAAERLAGDGALGDEAAAAWRDVVAAGEAEGFRNAQATAIAPTGTIGLLMDADTTGIEPRLALGAERRLAEGAVISETGKSLRLGLAALGHSLKDSESILARLQKTGGPDGLLHLRLEDRPVFATALGPPGSRLEAMAQVRMVAAVQPFISGSVSKTVNLPAETEPAEIEQLLLNAWRLGLKSIAVYRDGSKRLQPLGSGEVADS